MDKVEKRILVVDDDDAIRALLLTILQRRGLSVDVARNGADAIERLARCRYAVMLLDLMMPVMSGWEVLSRMKEQKLGSPPVVIVLTAGNEPRELGADIVAGTIRKPFDVELLLDTVSACIAAIASDDQLGDCPPADSERKAHSS
jgi:CheY-like chemotaxis protein